MPGWPGKVGSGRIGKCYIGSARDAARHLRRDLPDRLVESVFAGLDLSGVTFCICDEDDKIRFVGDAFAASFLGCWQGEAADFTQCLSESFLAGCGVQLNSMKLDDFVAQIRARRRQMVGSLSFTADTADGKWWRVTDAKLPNGWLIAVAQEISSLKLEELRLRDAHACAMAEAQTDFLTGAPNRRHGLQRAQALFSACRDSGRTLSVALLDIDHFKRINDVHGHDIGDLALVHFAGLLLAALGTCDQFSRFGGEEFLLVSDDQDLAHLETLLAGPLSPLAPLRLTSGEVLAFTASIGIARSDPKENWRGLLHRADMALYEAKANGRGRMEYAALD